VTKAQGIWLWAFFFFLVEGYSSSVVSRPNGISFSEVEMPRKTGTDTLLKLPKSASVPVFRLILVFVWVALIMTHYASMDERL